MVVRAHWHALQQLEDDAVVSHKVATQLADTYRAAGQHVAASLEQLHHDQAASEAEELRSTTVHLLQVEHASIAPLLRNGAIDAATAHQLTEEIDARLLAAKEQAGAIGQPISDTPVSAHPSLPEAAADNHST